MSLSSVAAAVIAFVGTAPAAVGLDAVMSEPVRLVLWGIVLLTLSRTIRGRFRRTTPVRPPMTESLSRASLDESLPRIA